MEKYSTIEGEGRIYKGRRGRILRVTVEEHDEEGVSTQNLWHAKYHSPSGFEWGYDGSGPADLALSLLMDAFNEEYSVDEGFLRDSRAWRLHQDFKREIVAALPRDQWSLEQIMIQQWANNKDAALTAN